MRSRDPMKGARIVNQTKGLDLALAETRLSALCDELRREIAGEQREVRSMAESQNEENESQHGADVGTDLFMEERALATQKPLKDELEAVEAALGRLAEGLYGQCIDCTQAIGTERLDARPQAIRCIACERKFEAGAR